MFVSAQFAAWIASAAALLAVLASVLAVRASRSASRTVEQLRSMTSLQAELVEMHDTIGKMSATMKRISGREYVRQHRENVAESDLQKITDKAELRRRVGLVAGHPAPHK